MSEPPACLICYRYRRCQLCGHELFDLICRSIDPIWFRCRRCGAEMAMPSHPHPGTP